MNGSSDSSPWSNPDFRRLWVADTLSATGSRITRTALPIIAISLLDASAAGVAALSALSMAPGVLVALLAAGSVDRAPKRRLLVAMDLIRLALLLSIPLAAAYGLLTLEQLVVVGALTGAATALFAIAKSAYVPRLVPPAQIVEGNTQLQVVDAVAEIAGPSMAGFLIQALTAPVAIVLDALSFGWSAWWLARIRKVEETAPVVHYTHPFRDVAIGWAACRHHPVVFPLLLAQGLFGLLSGFFAAVYMIFVLRTLALDETTVGLVIGVGGIGALWGAFAAQHFGRILGHGPAIVFCLSAWMLASALIPAAETYPSLAVPFLVAQQLVGDGFLSAFMILAISVRQTALDVDVQARASATFLVFEGLSLPAGALIAGALAEIVSPGTVLWIAVAGAVIPIAVMSVSPLSRLKNVADSRLLK